MTNTAYKVLDDRGYGTYGIPARGTMTHSPEDCVADRCPCLGADRCGECGACLCVQGDGDHTYGCSDYVY